MPMLWVRLPAPPAATRCRLATPPASPWLQATTAPCTTCGLRPAPPHMPREARTARSASGGQTSSSRRRRRRRRKGSSSSCRTARARQQRTGSDSRRRGLIVCSKAECNPFATPESYPNLEAQGNSCCGGACRRRGLMLPCDAPQRHGRPRCRCWLLQMRKPAAANVRGNLTRLWSTLARTGAPRLQAAAAASPIILNGRPCMQLCHRRSALAYRTKAASHLESFTTFTRRFRMGGTTIGGPQGELQRRAAQ